MPALPLGIALSALPAVLLLLYVLRLDRARPEPRGLVVKAVLFGFAAVLPAIVLELLAQGFLLGLVPPLPFLRPLFAAFLVAALVEEGLKYFFVKRFLFRRGEFDEVMDGIVYAVSVSMGFALVENVMYGLGSPWSVIIVRGLTAVPLHAAATGIMGYYLGLTRMGRGSFLGRGLLAAILAHGLYDFFLFAGGAWVFLAIPVVIAALLSLRKRVRRALELDAASAAALKGAIPGSVQ